MEDVIKIVMKKGCFFSNNPLDIRIIYVKADKCTRMYTPEELFDELKKTGREIRIPIIPYPKLIPVLSDRQEKYVRAEIKKGLANGLMEVDKEEEA